MEVACINGNSIASNVTSGITLAQDKMEDLMSLGLNDPELDDNNTNNNGDLRDGVEDFADVGSLATADDRKMLAEPGRLHVPEFSDGVVMASEVGLSVAD